jgi:hypothetical protein
MNTSRCVGDSRLVAASTDQCVQRIIRGGDIALLNLDSVAPPLLRPTPVEKQAARDREQPGAKRARSAKPIERLKGPDEGVLYQFLDVVSHPEARGEARQRRRVPLDERRRRAFVPRSPSRDELEVRFSIGAP